MSLGLQSQTLYKLDKIVYLDEDTKKKTETKTSRYLLELNNNYYLTDEFSKKPINKNSVYGNFAEVTGTYIKLMYGKYTMFYYYKWSY